METQKENKIDKYYQHLQPIPLFEYEDGFYKETIELNTKRLEGLYKVYKNKGVAGCVRIAFGLYSDDMDENGMEKACWIITAMLFEMKYNSVEEETAYEAFLDIEDLKTGKYDNLFSKADLKLLKEDIAKIDKFLEANPQYKN